MVASTPKKVASKANQAAAVVLTDKRFKIAYLVLTAGLAVFEAVGVTDKVPGDTISEDTRQLFHTSTRAGRSVWVILWSLFSGLFMAHIMGSNQTFWGSSKEKN